MFPRTHYLLAGLILVFGPSGCGTSQPIVLTPALTYSDPSAPDCPKTAARFYLEDVGDRRGNADPRDVGFTQTGLANTLTPLHTSPAPADLLKSAFSEMLGLCGLRSTTRADSDFVVATSLIALHATEVTGSLVESISVDLACEVTIRAAGAGRLQRRKILEARARRNSIDTTSYASEVIEQSLSDIVAEFAHLLECCPSQGGDRR